MKILMTCLLLTVCANADMATGSKRAKMSALETISTSATVSFFTELQKQRKLSQEEADVLSLTRTAQDVFGVKNFEVYASGATDESSARRVGPALVANSIQGSIQSRDWNQNISNSELSQVKKQYDRLKKYLGDNSYALAWLSFQMGEKPRAQKILSLGFAKSYEEAMNLKEIWGHGRPQPLQDGETISKALESMSTKKENESRAEKLKKMQTHISNLPDLQIMT